MACLTVAEVRQRAAAGLELPGWRQSRWPYGLFPAAEPGQYADHTYCVGAPRTEPHGDIETSRTTRGANGAYVETALVLQWLTRVRGDAGVDDYDAGLNAEAELYIAIGALSQSDCHFIARGMERQIVGDGTWMLGTISFACTHRLAIQ